MHKLTLAAILFASAFTVQASQQIDFNIEENVLGNDFYISAVNGWDSQTKKMSWDDARSDLTDISKQLTINDYTGEWHADHSISLFW